MICKLCHQEKERLANSHIIPNFLFRLLKRSLDPSIPDHRSFFQLSTKRLPAKKQTGLFENLLCADCESTLSIWERYVSQVLIYDKSIIVEDYPDKAVINGIDYSKFKLFQLSIIWKSSISNLEPFKNIKLGKHEEIIRNMLLKKDAGECHKYGCVVIMTVGEDDIVRNFVQNSIMLPEKIKFNGINAYRMLFGFLWWIQFIDKRSSNLPRDLFLSENGILPIYKEAKHSVNFIRKYAKNVKMQNKM